jgi:hypothetical protein
MNETKKNTDMKRSNSMEKGPSLEANSHSASQEIPCLFWNLNVNYCVSKRPKIPRLFVTFRNKEVFHGEELSTPRQIPKLEDHCRSQIFERGWKR